MQPRFFEIIKSITFSISYILMSAKRTSSKVKSPLLLKGQFYKNCRKWMHSLSIFPIYSLHIPCIPITFPKYFDFLFWPNDLQFACTGMLETNDYFHKRNTISEISINEFQMKNIDKFWIADLTESLVITLAVRVSVHQCVFLSWGISETPS